MQTLLQLNTSIFSSNGQSTKLADEFVCLWQEGHPHAQVTVRDLARDPVPHLSAERFLAFSAQSEDRTLAQQAMVDYSDTLIDELKKAEIIVIGLPMYNFGVPSTLKAYFDHVARAGVTFRYTDQGAVGLLRAKKVYVFAARGGLYAGTPADTQTSYVRDFLGFLGMEDLEFVYAEGLAISEVTKQAGVAAARQEVGRLNVLERLAA